MATLPPHPNVVGQYRAWQQGGHFYIQMDLCEGGSLAHLLAQVRGNTLFGLLEAGCGRYQRAQGFAYCPC